ncbi:HAMP domain-containing sensor histidine kinase [Cytobacillus oceanisediminis]|uniref:HAMP domain-containing sensor histidine kinase n=1 Tax=Cytobacillus oceanisediminis TaxID=665099 RepID=UPI001C226A41|nr:HAMP domain-containing histidine kinase [Cytobacillus oceanisediminis]MBU8767960.1 HAMP domain-containing histidine kinase [Cytobacillus oceanisediminis]
MNLRKKIYLYTTVLFAVLLLIMNIAVYAVFSKLIYENEQASISNEMANISKIAQRSIGDVPETELLRALVPSSGMVRLVQPDKKAVTSASPDEKELSEIPAEYISSELIKTMESDKKVYMFASSPVILPDGEIGSFQLTKSMESAEKILRTLRFVLGIVTVLAMIPVLISSAILSQFITRPVATMTATMKEIRKSGQFKRLELEGKSQDELHQMGETFNHMIDLLESNYEKQKLFISNASHELKTPLTVIESYSSLLKRRGLKEPELFNESIEAIHSEALRMKEMTEQLLLLARHDDQWMLDLKMIDLNRFLTQVIRTYGDAFKRTIQLESSLAGNTFIQTDENKLKQLLFIFLDNARKYSDDIIRVTIGTEKSKVYIRIEDRGMGIPQKDLSRVFDRFYRVDEARNRKTGGSGLGLSLAKEIADALGVEIRLESTEGLGTAASIRIKIS